MGNLRHLKNIGPAMEHWLSAVGIHTAEELLAVKDLETLWRRIYVLYPIAKNRMAYRALVGAVHGLSALDVPSTIADYHDPNYV